MNFDPSKMDPKLIASVSELVRELPPSDLARMQTLMHNMMAGLDVSREMAEFERTLPPGFRDRLMSLSGAMGSMGMPPFGSPYSAPKADIEVSAEPAAVEMPKDLKSARLTLLRGVQSGALTPDQAYEALFNS